MKKVWIVAILILLILVLGAGGWWLANNKISPTGNPALPPDSSAPTSEVRLYMIAYGDKGAIGEKIGCDDSLVGVAHTVASEDVLTGTYQDLLSLKGELYGESGLHNTLAKASLSVESTSVGTDGTANIVLTGTLNQSGICDAPRIQAQLEKPAKQFPGVKSVNVTINGKVLSDVLSLR